MNRSVSLSMLKALLESEPYSQIGYENSHEFKEAGKGESKATASLPNSKTKIKGGYENKKRERTMKQKDEALEEFCITKPRTKAASFATSYGYFSSPKFEDASVQHDNVGEKEGTLTLSSRKKFLKEKEDILTMGKGAREKKGNQQRRKKCFSTTSATKSASSFISSPKKQEESSWRKRKRSFREGKRRRNSTHEEKNLLFEKEVSKRNVATVRVSNQIGKKNNKYSLNTHCSLHLKPRKCRIKTTANKSLDKMLAPPTPTTSANWLDPNRSFGRESRSNSCVSDSAALLKTPSLSFDSNSRRPSAISIGALAPGQRAFLIRQKSTGEEVVVTMNSVKAPVMGARQVVGAVPSYIANAKLINSPMSGVSASKRSSVDDVGVNYDSLMSKSDISKRFSEMVDAKDVIAANRLEKIYQEYRKQAHAASDETLAPSVDRLSAWLAEKERRRKSCAVAEFGLQTACRSRSPYLGPRPKTERAHSIGLVIPNLGKMSSQISSRSEHGGSLNYDPRRRSSNINRSLGSQGFDATRADLEAAARHLRDEFAANMILKDSVEEEDMKPPPEKERKRMVLIVSCVALAITFFAASLVGLTLGLSHLLEGFSTGEYRNNL